MNSATNNWTTFQSALAESDNTVWLVARWMVDTHRKTVAIRPRKTAETPGQWQDCVDEGDLFIMETGGRMERIEVKRLSCAFTSEHDWPFPEMICYGKRAWDRADPKPHRVILVNRDATHAAILQGEQWREWGTALKRDRRYINHIRSYYTTQPHKARYEQIK